MTLDNLLEEIKYGKKFVEEKIKIGNIESFINEETNDLEVGKRLDSILSECDGSLTYVKKITRASRSLKEYESKLNDNENISTVYSRMKLNSIVEDVNSAITELENKKVLRESNHEQIGKALATIKYGIEKIQESTNTPCKTMKEIPSLIGTYYKKETNLIESVI